MPFAVMMHEGAALVYRDKRSDHIMTGLPIKAGVESCHAACQAYSVSCSQTPQFSIVVDTPIDSHSVTWDIKLYH